MNKLKNIKDIYNNNISTLVVDLDLRNVMMVPKIVKVVVNSGTGKISKESDRINELFDVFKSITGQYPVKVKSNKSIAGFKLREGQEIGMKVTLRGKRMWNFLDRLINSALPRVRDFQGISFSSIDSSGNLNIGIKEHTIFPEIVVEDVKNNFGFQINIVSSCNDALFSERLYRKLGFPLKKEN